MCIHTNAWCDGGSPFPFRDCFDRARTWLILFNKIKNNPPEPLQIPSFVCVCEFHGFFFRCASRKTRGLVVGSRFSMSSSSWVSRYKRVLRDRGFFFSAKAASGNDGPKVLWGRCYDINPGFTTVFEPLEHEQLRTSRTNRRYCT